MHCTLNTAAVLTMLLGPAILPALMGTLATEEPSEAYLALVGGTVYVSPTEHPIRDGVVLIRAGKIDTVGSRPQVQIPRSAQIIDCSGLTITAGFWNSHVHFFERKWANVATIPAPELTRQLQEMLARYGFTSVFDLGSMWENTRRLRDRIESGEVTGPRIRSTGEALVPPGALPSEQVLNLMGTIKFPAPEIADAASEGPRRKSAWKLGTLDTANIIASTASSGILP